MNAAVVGVAVREAEDDVEHDGEADRRQGEGAGADEFCELVAALFAEDASCVGAVRCGMEDGGGGHWVAPLSGCGRG